MICKKYELVHDLVRLLVGLDFKVKNYAILRVFAHSFLQIILILFLHIILEFIFQNVVSMSFDNTHISSLLLISISITIFIPVTFSLSLSIYTLHHFHHYYFFNSPIDNFNSYLDNLFNHSTSLDL